MRGPCGGTASPGSGARPSPTRGEAGPPLPPPAGTLRLCPGEAGVQQMRAGRVGWGAGERRGGENPQQNLRRRAHGWT